MPVEERRSKQPIFVVGCGRRHWPMAKAPEKAHASALKKLRLTPINYLP